MWRETQESLDGLKLELKLTAAWGEKPVKTPLLLPHNIAGVCTLRRGIPNYSKSKPLLKREQDRHMEQQNKISRLVQLYEQQLWKVDMVMQTEIMVPKIRAHLQGVSPLQHTDLEDIMNMLKRVSGRGDGNNHASSKRRRVEAEDDFFGEESDFF
jgi:hypothetical protein